ncbi:hypothetical protein B0H16DRAFT_310018 [Mycena metata]|uniref:F-box domain-containing protein n=1 Tax=Mycena metata TaxID=1033252 RepID=A0AAD7JN68_9AGAR|nr:hypothetical protein B0H16DRAFT_310018 [Mycena metata]
MALPIELIREIIGHVLLAPPATVPEEPSSYTTSKPQFSLISSVSLACRTYRTLALEAWFQILFTESPADPAFIQKELPEIHGWTRKIHFSSPSHTLTSLTPWNFSGFRRLQAIRVDCPVFHHDHYFHVPSTVTELDMRAVSWPSPFVVQSIAILLPLLVNLRLSHRKIWCGLCHTCCVVKFAGTVPANLVYTGGLGLPIHYARALSSMPRLRAVSITLPYSLGAHITLDAKDPTHELWSGECDRCVGIMYEDQAFRERWIARKKGEPGFGSPGDSAERLYIKPPALETVEWCFWRRDDEAKDEDDEEDNEEPGDDEDEDEDEDDEEDNKELGYDDVHHSDEDDDHDNSESDGAE